MSRILDRILRDAGGVDLLALLGETLSASDLGSLLLEVAARRASRRAPADLVEQYERDRFVRPSRADPRVLLAIEQAAYASVPADYQPIALAPLAPLGTTSVVATASQHKIVSTYRATEVVSDATNLLALECAVRRKKDPLGPPVALCTGQRMTRAQGLERPEHSAHFQLFATVLAGRDAGGRTFERRALAEAVDAQLTLLERLVGAGFAIGERRVILSPDPKHESVAADVARTLERDHPSVPCTIDAARITKSNYYRGLCFAVWVRHASSGSDIPLGDGGLTDWLAKLVSSRKERYFVGAIGTELLATVFAPPSPTSPSSRPRRRARSGLEQQLADDLARA